MYFETDSGDGFREAGFSKERRLEPQITIGLLTDAAGFPLLVNAFEGNAGETTTMLPSIQAFMKAHAPADVTVDPFPTTSATPSTASTETPCALTDQSRDRPDTRDRTRAAFDEVDPVCR